MADIFISYARADRPRIARLAQALEHDGWSVWWDREIPPGRSFDEVIEEALAQARCVIVVWSEASVRSEWVKTEAAEAAGRHVLVPILADGARIPLEFRRIQAAVFDRWDDPHANQGWSQLHDAVAALVGATGRPVPPSRAPRPRRVRAAVPAWAMAAIAGASGVALLAVAAFVLWRPSPSSPREPIKQAAALVPLAPIAAREPPAGTEAPAGASLPATAPAPRAAVVARRLPLEVPRATAERPPGARTVETRPSPRVAPISPPPSPIEPPAAAPAAADRVRAEPPEADAAAFEVALLYGVFRDQAGRLSVSSDGLHFQDHGGRATFELSCAALRRVSIATMIADREQRLVELSTTGQAYRLRAADTSARDRLRSAIGRSCGRS